MTGLNHADLRHLEGCAGESCRENVRVAGRTSNLETADRSLEEDVYHMAGAIMDDPVKPKRTPELGLSQAYRLHRFLSRQKATDDLSDLDDRLSELKALGLPVIGAEFHLPASQEVERLEEKLFVLNMAQYQDGSSIPLSRREGDLVEIRMNPSYFPVTMANWELMRKLLPIDKTTFFLSVSPIPETNEQLNDIKSLANVVYVAQYEIPTERDYALLRNCALAGGAFAVALAGVVGGALAGGALAAAAGARVGALAGVAGVVGGARVGALAGGALAAPDRICLGEHYLGQTQTLEDGRYRLTKYQLNLYSGSGMVFPEQAYYTSMAYLDPEILRTVRRKVGAVSLREASRMQPEEISDVLTTINTMILKNPDTRRATEIGQEIRGELFSL